jgi:UV DNA damage repair endonuclease
MNRVGLACKWLEADGSPSREFAFRDVNRQNFLRFGPARLREVAFHNVETLHRVVDYLEDRPRVERMFRVGNQLFPCLTLPEAASVWRDRGFTRELGKRLAVLGADSKLADVRLSTHPDQFVVPNSSNPDVAARGIQELDAWSKFVARMGLLDGFCMNVHLGPKYLETPANLVDSWKLVKRKCTRDTWRVLTVENDDKHWTATDLVNTAREVGFRPVLDPHHHWCVTGKWVDMSVYGKLVARVWGDATPKMHYSLPKQEVSSKLDKQGMPVLAGSVGNYRAHAVDCWPPGGIEYLRGMLEHADVMIELKGKNLTRDSIISKLGDR